MSKPNLESDQARWAEQCCSGGNCPVCNGNNDDNDELIPECPHCETSDFVERNSTEDWYCKECHWCEEDDKDTPSYDLCDCGAPAINTAIPNLCDNCHKLLSKEEN